MCEVWRVRGERTSTLDLLHSGWQSVGERRAVNETLGRIARGDRVKKSYRMPSGLHRLLDAVSRVVRWFGTSPECSGRSGKEKSRVALEFIAPRDRTRSKLSSTFHAWPAPQTKGSKSTPVRSRNFLTPGRQGKSIGFLQISMEKALTSRLLPSNLP